MNLLVHFSLSPLSFLNVYKGRMNCSQKQKEENWTICLFQIPLWNYLLGISPGCLTGIFNTKSPNQTTIPLFYHLIFIIDGNPVCTTSVYQLSLSALILKHIQNLTIFTVSSALTVFSPTIMPHLDSVEPLRWLSASFFAPPFSPQQPQ